VNSSIAWVLGRVLVRVCPDSRQGGDGGGLGNHAGHGGVPANSFESRGFQYARDPRGGVGQLVHAVGIQKGRNGYRRDNENNSQRDCQLDGAEAVGWARLSVKMRDTSHRDDAFL